MDPELKQILGEVKDAALAATAAAEKATTAAGAAADAAKDATSAANGAKEGLAEVRNIAIRNHQDTTRAIGALNRNFGVLWRRVHGSDPPPPDPNAAPAEEAAKVELGPDGRPTIVPSMPPLDEISTEALAKASQTSMELAALEGRMIDGFSATNARLDANTKTTETALAELKKQSASMGVGKAGVRWLFGTREGWKTVGILVAGFGGVYAALRPHEHAPPAAPQVIVVAAPASSAAPR